MAKKSLPLYPIGKQDDLRRRNMETSKEGQEKTVRIRGKLLCERKMPAMKSNRIAEGETPKTTNAA